MVWIIHFNPLSMDAWRAEEISREFSKADVVVLTGTQRRAWHDKQKVTVQSLENHSELSFGWSRGQFTNRSAGISIMVGRRFGRASVRKVLEPPRSLTGRGAAVRLVAAKVDLLVVALYYPPRTGDHMRTAEALTEWAHAVTASVGFRTCPIVCTDLNDGFGLRRDTTGRWKRVRECDPEHDNAGSVEPSREHGHSALMRDFMKLHHMCSVTSHTETGPTYYGEHSQSKIDHVIIPLGARGRVLDHRALLGSMRRLQLIKTATRRDHCPLLLCLDMEVTFGAPREQCARWDRDELMMCLTRGRRRHQFVDRVEQLLGSAPEGDREAMRCEETPDRMWEFMASTMRQAIEDVFPLKREAPPEYEEMRSRREELIQERRDLRMRIGEVDADGLAAVQLELTMVSRRCRVARRKYANKKEQRLIEGIWTAWKSRNFFDVHKLRVQLTGRGVGPKKRFYWGARRLQLDDKEWEEALSQPSADGGMSAVRVGEWDSHHEQYLKDRCECREVEGDQDDRAVRDPRAYESLAAWTAAKDQAWQDQVAMVQVLRTASKRKATPHWAAPVEAWLSMLRPNSRMASSQRFLGLGADKTRLVPTLFRRYMRDLLMHVRRSGSMPHLWHRSWGCPLDKLNGKPGWKGLRLVHVVDGIGSAWLAASLKAKTDGFAHDFSHGSLPNRCREDALIVQQSMGWRMVTMGHSTCMSLYDASNAFCCTRTADLDEATKDLVLERDMRYHEEQHRMQTVTIQTVTGEVNMSVGQGIVQGHRTAPRKFVQAYNKEVKQWSDQLQKGDPSYLMMMVKDPISGRYVDASTTTFVDDIAKRHIEDESGDGLAEKAQSSGALLAAYMGSRGYAVNEDKTEHVVQFVGKRSLRKARNACARGFVREARYLGPILGQAGRIATELHKREQAARHGWMSLGKVWFKPMPRRLLRMLFLAFVQGAMLTGMTAFTLTQVQCSRMDTVLCKWMRAMMKGKAHSTDQHGRHTTMTNTKVMQHWKVATCKTELTVRRLRMYQQWARNPQDHRQVIASVFGQTVHEQSKGVERLSARGQLVEASTPWARQLAEDFRTISEHDAAIEWYEVMKGDLLACFREGECRDMFLMIDVGILRAAEFTVAIPMVAYPDGAGHELEEPNFCYENPMYCDRLADSGEVCGKVFGSYRSLALHVRRHHREVSRIDSLVITNQCPFCMSTFSSQQVATTHVRNAISEQGSGTCRVDRAHWLWPAREPRSLQCPACTLTVATLAEAQWHIRTHLEPPRFIEFELDLPAPEAYWSNVGVAYSQEGCGDRRRRRCKKGEASGGHSATAAAAAAAVAGGEGGAGQAKAGQAETGQAARADDERGQRRVVEHAADPAPARHGMDYVVRREHARTGEGGRGRGQGVLRARGRASAARSGAAAPACGTGRARGRGRRGGRGLQEGCRAAGRDGPGEDRARAAALPGQAVPPAGQAREHVEGDRGDQPDRAVRDPRTLAGRPAALRAARGDVREGGEGAAGGIATQEPAGAHAREDAAGHREGAGAPAGRRRRHVKGPGNDGRRRTA